MFSLPQQWTALSVPPEKFIVPRQELHYAANVTASLGATLLPAHPGGAHMALSWESPCRLLGHEVKPGKAFRAALDLKAFELQFLGHKQKGYEIEERFSLAGHKLAGAFDWLEAATEKYLGHTLEKPLMRSKDFAWKMPGHALEMGAIFMAPNQTLNEVTAWYENAAAMLSMVAHEHPMNAGHLYCWPQNFALEFLFEQAHRSISVGFSAGDAEINEPYFYLKPHPELLKENLKPQLGQIHDQGWIGLYLKASDILPESNGTQQATLVSRFLHENMHLLGWF